MITELLAGRNLISGPKLQRDFYLKNSKYLAPKLLGKILVLRRPQGLLAGRIVETEAYLGIDDPASHSYQAKYTPRNKILYQTGGLIYVYSIYGLYFCFNIVANKKQIPQAVFIRALEPLAGIDCMRQNNKKAKYSGNLTNGPCRWTKSFGIDKSFLGEKIYGKNIFIINQKGIASCNIIKTKRIGIEYAKEARAWPLRFYIKNNPFVSKK